MSLLAQFRAQFDDGTAQFVGQFGQDTALAVVTDLDAGNIAPSSVEVTNATSAEPLVVCRPRATPSTIHWLFALANATGKRPVITVELPNHEHAMGASWRPLMSTDGETWTPADAFTSFTGPYRVEFQFAAPFEAPVVYLADHVPYPYARYAALAADLAADVSGRVHPSSAADASGVIAVSPFEQDELGRVIGENEIFGFRLEDTTVAPLDGTRKRHLVITSGIHAGEQPDGWILEGMLNFWRTRDDAVAQQVRRHWRVWVYFPLTPNGRRGGAHRTNFRVTTDPNRDWVARTLQEIAATDAAIAADTAWLIDAAFDLHALPNSGSPTFVYHPSVVDAGVLARFKAAFDAVDAGTLALVASDRYWSTSNYLAEERGAVLALTIEPGLSTNQTTARYAEIGEHYLEALQAIDDAGDFPVDPAPPATGRFRPHFILG